MAELFTKITAESAGSSPYEYNSVTISSGNAFAPSTDQAEAGSYSYKSSFGGADSAAYGTEIFGDQDEVYISFWFWRDSAFNMQAQYRYSFLFMLLDGGTELVNIAFRRQSGAVIDCYQIGGQDLTWTYPTSELHTGQWQHLEVYYRIGSSGDGICRVWIDDTLMFEDTGVQNASYMPDRIKVGGDGHAPVDGSICYYDQIEGMDAMPSIGGHPAASRFRGINRNNNVRYA